MAEKKHGGPGRGQGRKTPDSPTGELKVFSVRLDPETVKTLKEVGGGNVSAGIRILVKLGAKFEEDFRSAISKNLL